MFSVVDLLCYDIFIILDQNKSKSLRINFTFGHYDFPAGESPQQIKSQLTYIS